MATQTRVPGAASSEVDFELERFERTAQDRIEISGRWFGLRGRRFVRPVLNLNSGGARRRAIALLEHKPWAAEDGEVWLAAFRWPDGAAEVSGAELEVGPGLLVDLPALGLKAGGASVRVSALRPHVPAVPPWRAAEADAGDAPAGVEPGAGRAAAGRDSSDPAGRPAREGAGPSGRHSGAGRDSSDPSGRAGRDSADPSGRSDRDASDRAGRAARDSSDRRTASIAARAAAPAWTDAPRRSSHRDVPEPPARAPAPPRDIVTSVTAERNEAVAARDQAERERVTALQDRDDALSRRDAALRDVDRAVAERDEAVAERDRLAAELERVTRERDIAHAERNRTLQDSETVARERDQAAAERDAARSELSRALPARDEAVRVRDAEATRAEQAERERDTAFAERKSAVAQRDRARRERDRAMRAAGVDPPDESPYVSDAAESPAPEAAEPAAGPTVGQPDAGSARPAKSAATPPGTPLPSRPVKRIGAGPLGPAPEPKPLLTPVDAGRPRRLSRTRRPPSAPVRWAVRVTVLLLMIAIAVVLLMLLGSAL